MYYLFQYSNIGTAYAHQILLQLLSAILERRGIDLHQGCQNSLCKLVALAV